MLDSDRIRWISFDCYGTLVDWETGIFEAIAPVLASHGIRKSRAEILALFADVEPRVQSTSYLEYRHVLRRVMARIGGELGFQPTESELACLAESLPRWPVFPDTVGALRALQSRFKLAVISNVDDDLFAGTAAALGIDFEVVVTAQQVRSYKPSLGHFHAAAARMAVGESAWLHVAESLYHDIAPANRLANRQRLGEPRESRRWNASHRCRSGSRGARPRDAGADTVPAVTAARGQRGTNR